MAAFNRSITIYDAVAAVMGEMGLTPPPIVVGSTDKTALQLLSVANQQGLRLMDECDWQFLSKDFIINTVPGQDFYDLPTDFNNFIDDASWNRTTRMPAVGSLLQTEWAELQARNLGGSTFIMMFIMQQNQIQFYQVDSTAQTIAFPYQSRGWVMAADTSLKDQITADSDVILYDPALFKAAMKRGWRREKGFDSSAADEDYRDALNAAKGKDVPNRTLSLKQVGYPFININNIPPSGFGM